MGGMYTRPMNCPQCGFEAPDNALDCLKCSIIFSKWREIQERMANGAAPLPSPESNTSGVPQGGPNTPRPVMVTSPPVESNSVLMVRSILRFAFILSAIGLGIKTVSLINAHHKKQQAVLESMTTGTALDYASSLSMVSQQYYPSLPRYQPPARNPQWNPPVTAPLPPQYPRVQNFNSNSPVAPSNSPHPKDTVNDREEPGDDYQTSSQPTESEDDQEESYDPTSNEPLVFN